MRCGMRLPFLIVCFLFRFCLAPLIASESVSAKRLAFAKINMTIDYGHTTMNRTFANQTKKIAEDAWNRRGGQTAATMNEITTTMHRRYCGFWTAVAGRNYYLTFYHKPQNSIALKAGAVQLNVYRNPDPCHVNPCK